MLRGLDVRLELKEVADFIGSCGCAAKKKGAASGALRRGADVKLFLCFKLLSCVLQHRPGRADLSQTARRRQELELLRYLP